MVAAGDAERHRLERDLHDGAQQRLVGLSLGSASLRSARLTAAHALGRSTRPQAELDAALASLREVGHGLFPALLAEEGLAAALEALTEEAPVEIEIGALPAERLDPPSRRPPTSSCPKRSSAAGACPTGSWRESRHDRLVVEVEADIAAGELVGLEDRVGAAGGTLEVVRDADGRVSIRAEIPCGS